MKYKKYRAPVKDAAGGFWLSDLYASAFLLAKGHVVDRIEFAGQDKRFSFVFRGDDRLENDYAAYRRDADICAQTFVDAIYDLKERINAAMRAPTTMGEKSSRRSAPSGRST
jgi:hypothetical protein